ncbi:hypothetical protein D1610_13215 [Sphingomonas gilva]|uniref:Phytoene synthase n=1 Tax=Sphingomonas gilva TaxID=2305907 RepID=A0A396RTS2_9SPHN|nr:squalene/phytoene synthase family protein [Sphingomonas gilva]RHW17071.1 hypothetical protein D1610_13215 [Sphingomonas gilva]
MTQSLSDPDRVLALAYAPVDRRRALAALFGLDEALGQVVRGARDPLLCQMRLTWWHEALSGLGGGPAPSDPALVELIEAGVVPDMSGTALAALVDGWEALLEPDMTDDDLAAFAEGRGARMFTLGAEMLGADHPALDDAGRGWALCDLARHSSDPALSARALAMAGRALRHAMDAAWPLRLRALGALAALAQGDTVRGADRLRPAGHPLRTLRALRHRLTGR